MDKRHGILIVGVTIFVLCFVGTASAANWSVDGSGGADFTGIQDAINNAKGGDTIIVHSGIYGENVVVDKSVTLKGIGYPVVDAGGEGNAIMLCADGITLVGFMVTNSRSLWNDAAGIKVTSNNNNLTGNNASNNRYGIELCYSCNNTITGNNVCNNNGDGIELYYSCNNAITGNNVCNNNGDGISLYYSSSSNNNTITGNNVCNNNCGGIELGDSCNNTITGNNVSNNYHGIHLSFSSNNNTITGNVFVNDGLPVYSSHQNTVGDNTVNGKPLVYLEDVSDYKVEDAGQVILVNCNNITIENLDLSNTSGGIALWKTENSKISNNTVCCLYHSSNNNTITGNNVSNNNCGGIVLGDSSNNTIYFNNFINNTDTGYSYESTNIWNSPLEITYTYDGTSYESYLGNYWDGYEGTDAEGDGIGDTHYSIDSDSDESDEHTTSYTRL
jgi:parallel beta-helix repeat protein